MIFKKLIDDNKTRDNKTLGYTRYIVEYFKEFDKPLVVSVATENNVSILSVYDTNFQTVGNANLKDYKAATKTLHFNPDSYDFEVSKNPIATLTSTVADRKAVVQKIFVDDNYAKKGLGTYLLQLIQDYYKKSNYIGDDNGRKTIMVACNNFDRKEKPEKESKKITLLMEHARIKSDRNFRNFLLENKFNVTGDPIYHAEKPIISDRHLIKSDLLNDVDKEPLVQLFGEVVELDSVNYFGRDMEDER